MSDVSRYLYQIAAAADTCVLETLTAGVWSSRPGARIGMFHPKRHDRCWPIGATAALAPTPWSCSSTSAQTATRREDAAVPRPAVTCVVCQRSRSRGPHTRAGDVFICAECQADAKQLFEIQDRIWAQAGEVGESTGGADNPAHP